MGLARRDRSFPAGSDVGSALVQTPRGAREPSERVGSEPPRQTGDTVSVHVSEGFPPQVWKVSDVEIWDWDIFNKTLFGY